MESPLPLGVTPPPAADPLVDGRALRQLCHDLRTPLMTIRGWIEILSSQRDLRMVGEASKAIESSVQRQLRLIEAFQEEASLRQLLPCPEPVAFEVGEWLSEIRSSWRSIPGTESGSLDVRIPDSTRWFTGDPDGLARLLVPFLRSVVRPVSVGQAWCLELLDGPGFTVQLCPAETLPDEPIVLSTPLLAALSRLGEVTSTISYHPATQAWSLSFPTPWASPIGPPPG